MSVVQRQRAIEEFEGRDDVLVLLVSLKAAALGVNLTAANHVVLLDLWWNPATEEQAIDRAHRIGQTRTVQVTRLTVPGTVEERILALQVGEGEGEGRERGIGQEGGRGRQDRGRVRRHGRGEHICRGMTGGAQDVQGKEAGMVCCISAHADRSCCRSVGDTAFVYGLLRWVTPELVAKSLRFSLSVSSSLPCCSLHLLKLSTSQESKRQLISSAMTGKEGLSSARLSKAELEALLTHDV